MLQYNKSIIIIQARTSSKRFPNKVMKLIEGIPIILLAVKRASNTGKKIIVATSNHKSDDKLVKLLKKENISYFRGNLKNVLSRFANLIKYYGYNKNQLIFRLTADNVFPDGHLLNEMEKYYLKKKIKYLSCGKNSGLPFGLSAELTRAKYIIEANKKNLSFYEREHVTPYIIKKYKAAYYDKNKHLNMENYRCTIDYIRDYFIVKKTFKNLKNKSTSIHYKKLLPRLKQAIK